MAQMSWHKCHDFPVDHRRPWTLPVFGGGVVELSTPRTSSWALAAHLRPTRAEWQSWFTQSFEIILLSVHVCTYLYYSVVFFEPVPLPRLPLWVVVACVPVPLHICGVVPPSAVQHFDLHGEAKRAVSATAEVHTGIVGWQSDVGRWFVHLEFI